MPRKQPAEGVSRATSERALLKDNESKTSDALEELHQLLSSLKDKNGQVADSLFDAKASMDHLKGNAQRSRISDILSHSLEESDEELVAIRNCLQTIHRYHSLRAEKKIIQRQFAMKKSQKSASTSRHSLASGRQPMRRGALMVLLQKCATNVPLWIGRLFSRLISCLSVALLLRVYLLSV